MKRTRRHFSPEQKVAILREHFLERISISDLCDKHQIKPTHFYQWQKTFFERGAAAFEGDRQAQREQRKQEQKVHALEEELQLRNTAIAELLQDHVALKKKFGGR